MSDEIIEGRSDAAFTEKAAGAESTYVHGGQRALENPPRSGADDVNPEMQTELNEMHVDSKLSAGEAPIPGSAPDPEATWREDDTRLQARRDFGNPVGNSSSDPTKTGALNHPDVTDRATYRDQQNDRDEFGRTPEQLQEIERKREEANKAVDQQVEVRQARTAAIGEAADAMRDRTLAVQEEVSTRARDGAVPGTPAFERRKQKIREIVGETDDGMQSDRSHADRIRDVASRLHTHSASALEEVRHELMAIASEMDDRSNVGRAA